MIDNPTTDDHALCDCSRFGDVAGAEKLLASRKFSDEALRAALRAAASQFQLEIVKLFVEKAPFLQEYVPEVKLTQMLVAYSSAKGIRGAVKRQGKLLEYLQDNRVVEKRIKELKEAGVPVALWKEALDAAGTLAKRQKPGRRL